MYFISEFCRMDGWMARRGMVESAGNHFRLGVMVRIHFGVSIQNAITIVCTIS